ncbi:MAG: hypothetical protein HY874_04445 [Chloroflexi bacterium]|nr:hypothetical protein [Chloroflexota bacterium]
MSVLFYLNYVALLLGLAWISIAPSSFLSAIVAWATLGRRKQDFRNHGPVISSALRGREIPDLSASDRFTVRLIIMTIRLISIFMLLLLGVMPLTVWSWRLLS